MFAFALSPIFFPVRGHTPMTVSPEILAALAKFDTPTICNAIELFEVRPRNTGFMNETIGCEFPELPPMVGFAATASFRSDAPPSGRDAYSGIEDQLEQFEAVQGPPVVVFQDLDDPPVAATFGEVMCSTYKAFGAVGLITSGAGRDIDQVGALDFPVFTGGTICSHAYCHLLYLGLPVRVGGLNLRQGDLVHGDANGVTHIPMEIADELPEVCEEFVAAEKLMLDFNASDAPKTVPAWLERRRAFQDVVNRLRLRISRALD